MIYRHLALAAALAAGLVGLAAMSTGAQAGAVLDRIKAKGVVVMSTDPEYPPQSSLDPENKYVGFDIDVGTEIAKRLGAKIQFVTPGWDVITGGNWGGRWDLSVGSMTPTKERRKVLDFPAIYYFTPAVLAVHKDNSTIATPADAKGKNIGVVAGTTYESYLKGNLVIDAEGAPPFEFKIAGATIKTYETDQIAVDDLRFGDGTRLDGVVTALPMILASIKGGYPLKIVGDPLYLEPLAIAIDKGDSEFAARLTEIVAAMHKDGTLKALSEKWYGADLTSPK